MDKGKLVFKILLISTFLAYAFLLTWVDAFPKGKSSLEKRIFCADFLPRCPPCYYPEECVQIPRTATACRTAECQIVYA
ncbi:hypothetical protein G9A89_017619 [Geosiphon pyriformis]|nr:hypothetical protein G9A89_017619 [Geosiphon pyriformis]